MLQTENLTLLQNLAVVSRSPDITEAIVKQNYRVLSLLDQSVFSNTKQKPPVQQFTIAKLKTCPCLSNHLLARRELTTMLCNCFQVVCSRSAISRISRLASGISADELVARYASSNTCATRCHWSPIA